MICTHMMSMCHNTLRYKKFKKECIQRKDKTDMYLLHLDAEVLNLQYELYGCIYFNIPDTMEIPVIATTIQHQAILIHINFIND